MWSEHTKTSGIDIVQPGSFTARRIILYAFSAIAIVAIPRPELFPIAARLLPRRRILPLVNISRQQTIFLVLPRKSQERRAGKERKGSARVGLGVGSGDGRIEGNDRRVGLEAGTFAEGGRICTVDDQLLEQTKGSNAKKTRRTCGERRLEEDDEKGEKSKKPDYHDFCGQSILLAKEAPLRVTRGLLSHQRQHHDPPRF